MAQEEINEQALEKLAWIIAEEFLDSCDLLSSLSAAENVSASERSPKPMRMVFAWGNPAVALPNGCRVA